MSTSKPKKDRVAIVNVSVGDTQVNKKCTVAVDEDGEVFAGDILRHFGSWPQGKQLCKKTEGTTLIHFNQCFVLDNQSSYTLNVQSKPCGFNSQQGFLFTSEGYSVPSPSSESKQGDTSSISVKCLHLSCKSVPVNKWHMLNLCGMVIYSTRLDGKDGLRIRPGYIYIQTVDKLQELYPSEKSLHTALYRLLFDAEYDGGLVCRGFSRTDGIWHDDATAFQLPVKSTLSEFERTALWCALNHWENGGVQNFSLAKLYVVPCELHGGHSMDGSKLKTALSSSPYSSTAAASAYAYPVSSESSSKPAPYTVSCPSPASESSRPPSCYTSVINSSSSYASPVVSSSSYTTSKSKDSSEVPKVLSKPLKEDAPKDILGFEFEPSGNVAVNPFETGLPSENKSSLLPASTVSSPTTVTTPPLPTQTKPRSEDKKKEETKTDVDEEEDTDDWVVVS